MAKKAEKPIEKIEREYIIPLRIKWQRVARYKRANKAIKAIKEFLVRHMKIRDRDLKKIKIDKYLNEAVWFRGIKNPPIKIKVKAIKQEGIVYAELAEIPQKLKFKKAREENREGKALEKKAKKKAITKPEESTTPKEEKKDIEKEGETGKEEPKEDSEKPDAKKTKPKESGKPIPQKSNVQKSSSFKDVKKIGKQPKRQQRKALAK